MGTLKKLIAAIALATAVVAPASPAHASEPSAVVRVTDCPPGYTGVVQAWNEKRGWYDVVVFCIPWGP